MAIDTIPNTLSNILAGRPTSRSNNALQSGDNSSSRESNYSAQTEIELRGSTVTPEYPTYSRNSVANSVAARQTSGESDQTTAKTTDSAKKEEELAKLRARDREVRNHEAAHLAALGAYKKGGASFTTQTGPDGKQYAVGGEVPIDLSTEATPEETINKAQTIRQAALAPTDPSPTDRQVAAKATQMETAARSQLLESNNTVKQSPAPNTGDQNGGSQSILPSSSRESSTPSATHLALYRRALDYAPQPSHAQTERRSVNMRA